MKYWFAPVFVVFVVACSSSDRVRTENAEQVLDCEIGIVGGGPAGAYLAYRLAPKYGDHVCVFEKEAELGGRMRDERISDAPDAIRIGTGARRVNATQTFVLGLAKELGIQLQTPEKRTQLILSKGRFGYSPDAFVSLYPRLAKPGNPADGTREDQIYALLLAKENVAKAAHHLNVRDYIGAVAGADAVAFLRTSSRFHADFDYDLSAPNYLDYLKHEFALSSVNRFPVGGMSMFVRKMEAAATQHHVRFFTSEPLVQIDRVGSDYLLHTTHLKAKVHRLVIAAPPVGFDPVKGELAEEIRKAPEYQALLPIRIVVINQVWPTRWWETVRDPSGKGNTAKTWRAWSTDQCVNHTEIPQEAYAAAGNVTRSVYTDDPKCAKYWEDLLAHGGIPEVEAEVVKGLSNLFNHKLNKVVVTVPKPLRTTMKVWPAGWYYIRAGSAVSNKRITEWAVQPLAGQENLMMLGEAYWPDRPGWSEGAYFSVHTLLDARFKDVPHPN